MNNTGPNADNRRNFATDLYKEAVVENQDCTIYANGRDHRTLVLEDIPAGLFDAIASGKMTDALLAMRFRRVLAISETGEQFARDISRD